MQALTQSPAHHEGDEEEEQVFSMALLLVHSPLLSMAMQAAIELDLFEIIARAGPGALLSASEVAAQVPTHNPKAPFMVDRILGFLASHSVLTCSFNNDNTERLYGLTPLCKYLVRDEDGGSLAPLARTDRAILDAGLHLKEAVLEDVLPFEKVHGVSFFEYMGKKDHRLFKAPDFNYTKIVTKKILKIYNGFENRKQVVDVGGSYGTVIRMVTSKYPSIKGINFDLPQVIGRLPPIPGVKLVGGDMFVSVPNGDTIILKSILHDWNDEQCVTILKNCYKALPEDGMVIVLEMILPTTLETNASAKEVRNMDLMLMLLGGQERTEKQYEALAKAAGFAHMKLVCCAFNFWVMEFNKKM